jgi:hypothetical protein
MQLDLEPGLLEEVPQELDAGALVARRVRRVEPDQVLQKLDRSH